MASIGKINRINAYNDGSVPPQEHEFSIGIAARYSVLYTLLTDACEQGDKAACKLEAEYIVLNPAHS